MLGTTIGGRFTVETHLGTFAGRELYAGRQPALERPVAIKMVQDPSNEDLCRRFLREGRLLAKLDHPGIVSVIDVGQHEGRPYVVTDAPKGDTLEAILEVRGRIDWHAAHDLLIALADAAACAHCNGLVHRDLHPRNIVVGADGMPRITDFIFAYETAPYSEAGTTQLITARGAVVGAIEWVAPEQLMGFPVDARADLYSLGVLAYRMIAGHVPHQGTRAAEILSLASTGATPLMAAAGLPESARPFAELVDGLLAHEADRRGCRDAGELAGALRRVRSLHQPDPDSTTRPAFDRAQPFVDRALELGRTIAARAQPLIDRARALPRRTQLAAAAGVLGLSIVAAVAMASNDAKVIDAQPIAAAPIAEVVEPSQLALRQEARLAAQQRDVPRALYDYRTLADASAQAFEDEDYQNVVAYLARPNTNTSVAEQILLATAPDSMAQVRAAFDDPHSSRYLKRRAGEVLEKAGEEVDLIPLWIATLQSDECGARKLAVRRLAASGDPRAVAPLQSLARSFGCGSDTARASLKRSG